MLKPLRAAVARFYEVTGNIKMHVGVPGGVFADFCGGVRAQFPGGVGRQESDRHNRCAGKVLLALSKLT